MRSAIISLCFLWVVLMPSLSMSTNSWMRSFSFNPVENFLSKEKYEQTGQIVDRSASSITIKMELHDHPENKLIKTRVRYRPTFMVWSLSTLQWNESAGCYIANESQSFYDEGMVEYPSPSSPSSLGQTIVVENLLPDMDYLLNIESLRQNDIRLIATTVARTDADIPLSSLKTGTGCFHVYNISEDGTRRTVRIFWQHNNDHSTFFEAFGYETDTQSISVPPRKCMLREGSITVDISLNRHTFIFRSIDKVGYYIMSSTVEIPAQKDILPPVKALRVFLNTKSDNLVLTWERPKNENVVNYTVFWYEMWYEVTGVKFIRDFVYLSKDVNTFEVKSEHLMGLAVSVNTEKGSSGLQTASYK